jgi:hypothetical protein
VPAVPSRLDALTPLLLPRLRESVGRHELDGEVPDLSPEGIRAALDGLGGPALDDPHDEAHLAAFERAVRVQYGELEQHRRNARPLLAAMDLSGYARPYAPRETRDEARRRHLARWPELIDGALASLDQVPATMAQGLLGSVRGAAHGVDEDEPGGAEALRAHARLVGHLEHAATAGDPDPSLGAAGLAALLGAGEALDVDLARMEEQADAERARLRGMLLDATSANDPDAGPERTVASLLDDHPDADGVLDLARQLTDEALAFTRDRGLVDERFLTGDCRVAPSPPSRRWATAMMSWSAPYEPDGPSWYYISPPDPSWPDERQRQWLSAFSRTTLPSTTVHEVAPGHFVHGRALRAASSDVRRSLHSSSFIEGWAHYAEELCIEEGFRAGDPRFVAGVALKALLRVTRMAVAIGLHSRTMDVEEAVHRFREDALVRDAVAEAETARATFDPTYGRYTWGKLEILALRDEARRRWGATFTLRRFHDAMLSLGAPPLGLLPAALEVEAG